MKLFSILLLLIITGNVYAQDSIRPRHRVIDTVNSTSKDISVVTGLHFGKYIYAEVGLARTWVHRARGLMAGTAAGIGAEVQVGKDILVAPKISYCMAGSTASMIELNALYYTDFKNGTFVFRPMAGFGMPHIRLLYGYNVRFGDKRMNGISSHMVSLIALPISFAKTEQNNSPR
jgi:hypothetical protein